MRLKKQTIPRVVTTCYPYIRNLPFTRRLRLQAFSVMHNSFWGMQSLKAEQCLSFSLGVYMSENRKAIRKPFTKTCTDVGLYDGSDGCDLLGCQTVGGGARPSLALPFIIP